MTHAHQFSETVIAPELWICAPSRALTVSPGDEKIDHARIDAAVSSLRELGWSVKEAANVRKVHKSFAGTDAERAAREVLFFDGVPACASAGATLAAAVQLMGTGKAKRPLCVFAGRKMYE